MAKRKRLTPATAGYQAPGEALETKSAFAPGLTRGPISQVSGDAAVTAALEELAGEMRQARDSGRLIQMVPLDQIEDDYLVRDRVVSDDQQMQALVQSIATRGQQQPVELVQLGEARFGLISGWRRLTALRQLLRETGDTTRFGHVQAMLRRPETAGDAYLSMVEENEIRVGLSYYERARIAAKAVELGVYAEEKAALLALFATASRAKRSKIRSFLPIYHHLGDALNFGGAIPERLGLRLSKALINDASCVARLIDALVRDAPTSQEAEATVIETVLAASNRPAKKAMAKTPLAHNVNAALNGQGSIILSGPGVDEMLLKRLRQWLSQER
jgi:ParB family transcriptional regulator, chromosome partitioning protein